MSKRAIVLPSCGDPLLLNLWLKCHTKNSINSVDKIYLKATSDIDRDVMEYIADKYISIGSKVWLERVGKQHGHVLRELLEEVTEESIVLLEDDFFITSPDVLEEPFSQIEDNIYDCIGSARGCCSVKMTRAITEKFNMSYTPEPNFWPCLFFTKTETLRKTDGWYAAKMWPKGTTIPYINMECDVNECGDSFVWASIQLRHHGNTFGYLDQNHTAPDDIVDFTCKRGLYSKDPIPWVHIGSLSTGIISLLQYKDNIPLAFSRKNVPPASYVKTNTNTLSEYTRRLAMFQFIADYGKLEDSKLDYYNEIYQEAVTKAIKEMEIPEQPLKEYYKIMKYIFKSVIEENKGELDE